MPSQMPLRRARVMALACFSSQLRSNTAERYHAGLDGFANEHERRLSDSSCIGPVEAVAHLRQNVRSGWPEGRRTSLPRRSLRNLMLVSERRPPQFRREQFERGGHTRCDLPCPCVPDPRREQRLVELTHRRVGDQNPFWAWIISST